ncbi:putative motility protein [Halomonas sp. SpR1]|uniref:putative motility protein n=1 Tax=Halomonas sp. SpR1 TaxID=3050462 RepID=UPI0027E5B617|nr:putative motility protein [Halomonas sp. SpR1]MDQ7735206.1 putative motility protein [Halomonas sp. SpR1]
MDAAVNNMVNATLDMRQAQAIQQAQFSVFKEALDGQAAQITALMDGAVEAQLATSGSVGTQINTTA